MTVDDVGRIRPLSGVPPRSVRLPQTESSSLLVRRRPSVSESAELEIHIIVDLKDHLRTSLRV